MYPFWLEIAPFQIGSYEIGGFRAPTFGPMVVLAFLVAYWVLKKEFIRKSIDPELASSILTAAIVGGWVGAKLYFVLFEVPAGAGFTGLISALFSGSGLTWYGGFLVATVWIVWLTKRRGVSVRAVADAAGMGLANGYGVGRIGCQLAGDGDYGIPTDLPWGRAYPNGVVPTLETVHPAPVYETLAGAAIFGVLWKLRKRLAVPGMLFCLYLVLSGVARFSVEIIRLNPIVMFGFTEAQLISLALVDVGVVGVLCLSRRRV